MITRDLDLELSEIERAAVELAEQSGRIVLGYYRDGVAVSYKDKEERDPVTAADRAVEDHLAAAVRERFPGHAILGEEGAPGRADAEYLWVVDPLDGTSNFVSRLPLFAVSIAVLRQRRPVVAAVYLAGSLELGGGVYHARLGGGAFVGERRLKAAEMEPKRRHGLVSLPGFSGTAFWLRGPLAKAPGDPRTLGSAAAELTLVADGVFQYGLFRSLKIWDVAAGVLLVEEAGGAVYRWRGWLRGWGRLERFEARRATADDPTGLRAWSEPLLAGGASAARAAARGSRPSFSVVGVIRRWLRARRRARRGGAGGQASSGA